MTQELPNNFEYFCEREKEGGEGERHTAEILGLDAIGED
jgi:hypothetical protein